MSCPWCGKPARNRHETWCPCSSISRREIRRAYEISDDAGAQTASRIRALAQVEANRADAEGEQAE